MRIAKGEFTMKLSGVLTCAVLLGASVGYAKDVPTFDKGKLLSMDSTSCGMAEKGSKTLAGEILGTDGEHKNTQEVLCQEYVLESDHIVYRIRPKDDKHPMLLPVGESVEFRIQKDKMLLRDPERDKKEREYVVISMQVRDSKNAQ